MMINIPFFIITHLLNYLIYFKFNCYMALIIILITHLLNYLILFKSNCYMTLINNFIFFTGLKQHNSMNTTSRLRCGRQTSVSSHGIIPQAKIRTVKMTFAIVIGRFTDPNC